MKNDQLPDPLNMRKHFFPTGLNLLPDTEVNYPDMHLDLVNMECVYTREMVKAYLILDSDNEFFSEKMGNICSCNVEGIFREKLEQSNAV